MRITTFFKPRKIQRHAFGLLKGGAKHILLFGGFQNGKNAILVMAIIFRAIRFAGSRHLIRCEGYIPRPLGAELRVCTLSQIPYENNLLRDLPRGRLSCRLRAKDARSSVLRETLLPALTTTIGTGNYTYLAHESMITLRNESEIWIGGLEGREQADKILGHEYNTIHSCRRGLIPHPWGRSKSINPLSATTL